MKITQCFNLLFFRSKSIWAVFLVLVFFLTGKIVTFGQHSSLKSLSLPLIQNYTKENYNANGSNQAIIQDHRQMMYFGNQDGVMEFDGNTWRLIPIVNRSFPKALAIERYDKPNSKIRNRGRVYTGGIGDFGYLNTDPTGQLQCVSLLDQLPEANQTFEDIISIEVLENVVIFQSFKFIFLLIDDQVSVIAAPPNPKEYFHLGFSNKQQYFIRQWGKGLLRLKGKDLELVKGGEVFQTERIYEILPFSEDTLLVATRTRGLQLYDGKQFIPWDNEANTFLIKNEVYCGAQLNANTFVFGTLKGGVIFIDKNGKIQHLIQKKHGLLDNLIFELFVDNNQNLWVGQSNGISHLAFDSPFRHLDERNNLEGQGFDVVAFNNHFWFGTLQSFHKMPQQISTSDLISGEVIQPVDGSTGSTMGLITVGDVLFAAQSTGIISIDKSNQVNNILKDRISFTFLPLKNDTKHLLAGTFNGVVLLENQQKDDSQPAQWVYRSDVEGFDESVFYLAEGVNREIWIGDEQKGIYKFQLNQTLDKFISKQLYDTQHGLPAKSNNRVFSIEDEIIITTEKGIYRYDSLRDTMISHPTFNSIIGETYVYNIFDQPNGDLWLWAQSLETTGYDREMEVVRLIKNETSYKIDKNRYKQANPYFRRFFPRIIPFDNDYVFMLKPSGVVVAPVQNATASTKAYPVFIREVRTFSPSDSLLFFGNANSEYGIPQDIKMVNKEAVLHSAMKNIQFKWSALSYTQPEDNLYSYQLENFDKDWSEWSNRYEKEYTNIPSGTYRFKVKARNVVGQESIEAIYEFTIATPWYLKWPAFVGYFLLGALLLRGVFRLYLRRLVEQKQALEATVQERTREIQAQKTQIEIEKQKSDDLLLNILPHETAEELKAYGSTKARKYDSVSVLFTDFKNFSAITQHMDPEILVPLLDSYFTRFDQIIVQHNLEKIKTMGDSFMCAGGIPQTNDTHHIDIVLAGLKIRDYVEATKQKQMVKGLLFFDIRIGIHTGPIVAGVVGSRKYAYDIWGTTVNLASRMESFGLVGKVNISEDTYDLIKHQFNCVPRGKVKIKKLGEVNMYWVKGQL